jgi:hypothetical protein
VSIKDRNPPPRARLVLCIAAAIASLQAIVHLAMLLRSQPGPQSIAGKLLRTMQATIAPGGTNYEAMYFGYELLSAATAFLTAALVWIAATYGSESRALARRLVIIILVATIVHAVIIARYFFALPLYFDIALAALLAIGWLRISRG